MDLADDIGDEAGIIIVGEGVGRVDDGGRVNENRQEETKKEDDEKAAH